ncbi:LOW QUALITY PROTEIN: hypothetical protein YC2023_105336 [Brassica napus]
MFALFIRSRSNVESLQLKLNPNNSRQDFKDLVNYAVARSLRELRIEMLYKSFEFPQSLYLYPQLETLILEKLSLVDIPSNVSLIGVKKLHLLSVRFSSDESVTKLLSRCPLLEDLVVRRSTYTNVMVFTIDVPTLKCLSIDNTSGKSRPEGVHGFVINAPSLRCFSIKDTFSNYVRFGDMPELVKASVNIVCDQPIPTERETVQSTSSKIGLKKAAAFYSKYAEKHDVLKELECVACVHTGIVFQLIRTDQSHKTSMSEVVGVFLCLLFLYTKDDSSPHQKLEKHGLMASNVIINVRGQKFTKGFYQSRLKNGNVQSM